MDGIKSALASKTVWGGIIAVAAPVIGIVFKINVVAEDAQALADLLAGIFGGLGGVIAIYGRIVATKAIL